MSRSRAHTGKGSESSHGRDEAAPSGAFSHFATVCGFPARVPSEKAQSNQITQPCEKLPEPLALEDSQGHDSVDWGVTDDWPKQVPITSDEVEMIEAFLREAVADLLK